MESALPHLYTRWLLELTGGPIPRETRATCEDCAMCKKFDPPHSADIEFNPRVKCCSYNPKLPNFLVGAILGNEDPAFSEGRQQFEREALKQFITPYQIQPPFLYWLRYHELPFGLSEKARCPYYIDRDGGLCAIYPHRNSRCSTWFCKHENRRFGAEFWQSVDTLLTVLEDELAKWCVQTIDLKRSLDPRDFPASVWGVWVGRQPDFFKKCWELVEPLTINDAICNAGEAIRPLANNVVSAFAQLQSGELPEVLLPGNFTTERIDQNRLRVRGYRQFDPIDLNEDLVAALPKFDGRPNPVVLRQLNETGISIDHQLLQTLYEYKILIPAIPLPTHLGVLAVE